MEPCHAQYRSASQPERIGVWQALDFSSLQLRHGAGFVQPDVLIELLRQVALEVMARELSSGPLDDADRAACAAGLPRSVVLMDAGYGCNTHHGEGAGRGRLYVPKLGRAADDHRS